MNRPKLRSRRSRQPNPERRRFPRYRLRLPLTVTACWDGQPGQRLLDRASTLENISAGGIYFALSADAAKKLPHHAELEFHIPLVEPTFHPVRVYAYCRGRVVRRDLPCWVAAEFDQVQFVRVERGSGLPVPLG